MSAKPTFISFNHAERLVYRALRAGITPILRGSPSSGKTAIGNKVAKKANLKPILFSLMDHTETDMSGLPDLSGEKATFKPFDTFPVEGDPLPLKPEHAGQQSNYDMVRSTGNPEQIAQFEQQFCHAGWLIELDEFSSGTRAMQAAANKVLYERMVGNKKLHPRAKVMAMGNLATDDAFVIEEPAHTKSRMAHMFVQQDVNEWIEWAFKAKLDMRVIAFVEMQPHLITRYDPEYVGINYPCARTMEMLSDLSNGQEMVADDLPLYEGVIGQGEALNFYNFCQMQDKVPSIQQIQKDPVYTEIPDGAQHRYAVAMMLSQYLTVDNCTHLMQYINRLPKTIQFFLLRAAVMNNAEIMGVPVIEKWADEVADKYY